MRRFALTPHAGHDLDEVASYLEKLPKAAALRIGRELQACTAAIVSRPGAGQVDKGLTVYSGATISRYLCGDYLIHYSIESGRARVLGVLHGRRDIEPILRGCLA